MSTFKELWLSSNILSMIESLGYTEPTPIQEKVIPLFLKNEKDIVWQARTWSGKTAAFGLPLADLINKSTWDIKALVMTPTRELAVQVSKQLQIYAQKHKLKVAVVYWWQNIQKEIVTFKQWVDILVATPGRIIDHIKRRTVNLKETEYFILDEFDEMLKMWFIEDVDYVLSICEKKKRLLFFSATLPRPIQNIIKKYMPEYEHINIQDENNSVSTIQQFYYNVPESLKFELLYRLILTESDFYGIVFCKRRIDVDNLSQKLLEKGIQSEVIHWEIWQNQREKALEKFKKWYNKVLIATDVAARWIDIQDLGFVINYDLPEWVQEYTHRIWRTGRAGKSGVAMSFVGKRDIRNFLEINAHVWNTIQLGKIPSKKDIMKSFLTNLETQIWLFKTDDKRPEVYEDMINGVLEKFDAKDIIYYFMQTSFKLLDPQDVHIENFEINKNSRSSSYSGGSRWGYRWWSRSWGGNRWYAWWWVARSYGPDRWNRTYWEKKPYWDRKPYAWWERSSSSDRPYRRPDADRWFAKKPESGSYSSRSSYSDKPKSYSDWGFKKRDDSSRPSRPSSSSRFGDKPRSSFSDRKPR